MHSNDLLDNLDFGNNPFFQEDGEGEVVAKYYSVLEAEVAAARLRSEGLPCFLANTTSQSVLTHVPVLVRLHVRPVDLEQARAILAEAALDTGETENPAAGREALVAMALLVVVVLLILLVLALGSAD